MFRIIAVFTSACVGGTPSPTTGPAIADTSDSGEPTVAVTLKIWEEDRACFGVLHRDLPEQYWSGWNRNDADSVCLYTTGGSA
jgi:hypothetical protein